MSVSPLDRITTDIATQPEHHRTRTFQEELLALLKRHGVEYDGRCLWR